MVELVPRSAVSLWSRALRAWERLSPFGFAKLMALNARLLVFGGYRHHAYAYDLSFDQQHGVDTAGTVAVEELAAGAELKKGAHRYEPASPDFVNFLIDRLNLDKPGEHLFIDVGAGKGRVMLLAAMAGFRRVVGLEFDTRLACIANKNVELFGSRNPEVEFTVVEGDATAFAFPAVPTVLFLNNPFGAQLVTKLLDSLDHAHDNARANVTIVYMHSVHADLICARDQWEELERGIFRNRRQFYSILRRRGRTD